MVTGSGASLARQVDGRLSVVGFLANGVAATVVLLFAGFFVPGTVNSGRYLSLAVLNIAVFVPYLAITLPAGRILIQKKAFAPIARWLRSDRPATSAEQLAVLRFAHRWALLAAVPWVCAVPLFTAINLTRSGALATRIGMTGLLGGLTACALQYLLVERAMRPVVAVALAGGPPPPRATHGVSGRITMAWTVGAGVPLLGVVAIAVSALVAHGMTRDRIAGASAVLGVIGLTVGLLAIQLASRSVGDPLIRLRDALADVEGGNFDAKVDVDDGSEVGLLQAGFNRMVTGLRERERLREAFGSYVDPAITERVLSEGIDLAGEELYLSVLFLDVKGFTSYAEAAAATEVVARLNALFDLVVPIVVRHHGHANKFVGDGLLAVFGAPERVPDHADCATACALEVAAAVKERFGDTLSVGIGVNTGQVIVGTVGGGGRLDFTVIGDAVNTAARVEAATRLTGDDVLITEQTLLQLHHATLRWERRPAVELKGKAQAVVLYAPHQPVPATDEFAGSMTS